MNKGEFVQSYIMRISHRRYKLQRVGEIVPNRELVIVTLKGLPPIWETLITTIRNNNIFSLFLGESSRHKPCFIFLNTTINSMFDTE